MNYGTKTLFEPSAEETKVGFISIDYLLNLANEVLKSTTNFTVWILLDRLDVAFTDNPTLETNALRALFRVYLDMAAYTNIKLKYSFEQIYGINWRLVVFRG